MNSTSHRASKELLGESVVLDFINPVVVDSENDYFFSSYESLIDWGVAVGTVNEVEAGKLRSLMRASAENATKVLGIAKSVRATFDAVLRAMATGVSAVRYLAALQEETDAAFAHRRLSVRNNRITWDWPFDGDLGRTFWPIVPAAIELLMSPALANLKVCPGCGWLFLDNSKNHSRKWCRMSDCGNVAKVRSHRKRDKQARTT